MNKKKVLVIDDEQIVLDSVRKIMWGEDYAVETAQNGREGIQRALKNAYDIVLTDVRMPDISGKIVLREIKRAKPALPVVIISGYATVQSAIQCMKLGAANVLEKPFTPDELIGVVEEAVAQSAQAVPDEQGLIHEREIRSILERAATDARFAGQLNQNGPDALECYRLTQAEKLALLTGDIEWLEQYMGILAPEYKNVLLQKL
ncbi:MAG: response regulator [Desulfobacteraceae bacterium]|nr:MAG: response regulator [Desulfobacteraceae bacterium]